MDNISLIKEEGYVKVICKYGIRVSYDTSKCGWKTEDGSPECDGWSCIKPFYIPWTRFIIKRKHLYKVRDVYDKKNNK